ncbi:histidine phosphatase family protein [[Actinomadura] parvosata]|uniref:histidine phosphatase family protein n=1 Tax=[Actinomadura] parvosata TaxID=1955412 RepID=UPI00406C1DB2
MERSCRDARLPAGSAPDRGPSRQASAVWAATGSAYLPCRASSALAAEPITRIYSSTALRAQQTAMHLATLPDLDIKAIPELAEVGIGRHEGTSDPAIRTQTAQVLHVWIVEQDLGQRIADGETGHQVVARMTAALQTIVSTHPGETVAVAGHVASLTVALGQLYALGHHVRGTPLPHARPFLIERDGDTWHCPAWPSAVGLT